MKEEKRGFSPLFFIKNSHAPAVAKKPFFWIQEQKLQNRLNPVLGQNSPLLISPDAKKEGTL
jgi:hypothetical protein